MGGIGLIVYGALKTDPGSEITPLIERRIPAQTPFPVEFGRYSRSRGGAPTVVPHAQGHPVDAEVLVLDSSVSLEDAKHLLFRREIDSPGSDQMYRESNRPTALIIADQSGFCDLDHALYVDFRPDGKLSAPNVSELAKAAVESVAWAPQTRDGISYLMDFMEAGISTPLTRQYEKEILVQTSTATLADARDVARLQKADGKFNR